MISEDGFPVRPERPLLPPPTPPPSGGVRPAPYCSCGEYHSGSRHGGRREIADREIMALGVVASTLERLTPKERDRVIRYVAERFNVSVVRDE